MDGATVQHFPVWTLGLYLLLMAGLVLFIVLLSALLGERSTGGDRDIPFESGVQPVGSARLRMSAKFYLIAVFFVIFDLESVFVYAWSVVAREAGWAGYIEMALFIVILLAALAYLWRLGALEWGPAARQPGRRIRGYER